MEPGCALCRRTGEATVTVGAHAFCTKCLSAIGKFFCWGPVPQVEAIWRAPRQELARRALTQIVETEIAKIREEVPANHPFVEDAIAAFKTDLSPAPRVVVEEVERQAEEALPHVDLALAYQQMGMSDEALAEAAFAISAAPELGDRAKDAAGIVLGPGFLRLGMHETLTNLRAVLFPG